MSDPLWDAILESSTTAVDQARDEAEAALRAEGDLSAVHRYMAVSADQVELMDAWMGVDPKEAE